MAHYVFRGPAGAGQAKANAINQACVKLNTSTRSHTNKSKQAHTQNHKKAQTASNEAHTNRPAPTLHENGTYSGRAAGGPANKIEI